MEAFETIETTNRKGGHIGTAIWYRSASKSFFDFNGRKDFKFSDITPEWLEAYETWMLEIPRSLNTVSMYTGGCDK